MSPDKDHGRTKKRPKPIVRPQNVRVFPAPDLTFSLGQKTVSIPALAVVLMLPVIVLPAAVYSFSLLAGPSPAPAQILTATCIVVFSVLLALWIMDVTSILTFRYGWVSKAIYGVAITSILGISVGVYQGAFAGQKFPYEGRWELTVRALDSKEFLADHILVMAYSESAQKYWGYSDARFKRSEQLSAAMWVEVVAFSTEDMQIFLRLLSNNGAERTIDQKMRIDQRGRLLRSEDALGGYDIRLTRPK